MIPVWCNVSPVRQEATTTQVKLESAVESSEKLKSASNTSQVVDAAPILPTEPTIYGYYLVQSVESLLQAVHIGLKNGYTDLVASAALELVECIGTRDHETAMKMLALYQSCHASKTMEKMLVRAFNDTHTSRGAALCRQQQLLKVSALSQQASPSSPKAINM